jgi:uncharacterized membrane protein (DUF441 family)
MIDALKEMISSKKAIAAIAGLIVAAAGRVGLGLPTDAVVQITGIIIAYIVGQGIADAGKHARVVTVKAPAKQERTY